MDKVLVSRKSDDWKTPSDIYEVIMYLGFYDPCPYQSTFDGLKIEWKEHNFVNPPYSKIKDFVKKSIEEHKKGKEVVLLIPARTDTKYFKELVNYGCDIFFVTGRLKFNDSGSAPFPSCFIILNGKATFTQWVDKNKILEMW